MGEMYQWIMFCALKKKKKVANEYRQQHLNQVTIKVTIMPKQFSFPVYSGEGQSKNPKEN